MMASCRKKSRQHCTWIATDYRGCRRGYPCSLPVYRTPHFLLGRDAAPSSTFDVGIDAGTPVSGKYRTTNRYPFTGELDRVIFRLTDGQ